MGTDGGSWQWVSTSYHCSTAALLSVLVLNCGALRRSDDDESIPPSQPQSSSDVDDSAIDSEASKNLQDTQPEVTESKTNTDNSKGDAPSEASDSSSKASKTVKPTP